jgi:hypothetical protein
MITKPILPILADGSLNPDVIAYNRQVLGFFRVLMLLYKLDVHVLTDQTGTKGYAPRLVTSSYPLYRIEEDLKVPLKTLRFYEG